MEIRTIIRDGVEKTAISIGPDDATIPAHLLQGIKKDGIIIAPDGTVEKVFSRVSTATHGEDVLGSLS